ncbi:unnamed protein product [Rhizophagus irregularis]|nr:unnamed protein product [Rhizophagus irregularis]
MSSAFGYHEHNRQMILINFYTNEISAIIWIQNTRFFHGLGMFLAWCVLFQHPIFIVRFFKHTDNYLKIHRSIQLLGSVSVSTFGAAAMATMANTRSPHAWDGINCLFHGIFPIRFGINSYMGARVKYILRIQESLDYSDDIYNKLPEFTWEEVNERVQRGASLVVCDGLVIDVRKWIKVHPGGAKILEKAIGTDITNDFYCKNNKIIM